MARHISLEPHFTIDELERRYRSTQDPVERSHWHFLWLLARGLTAKIIASVTVYSAYWRRCRYAVVPSLDSVLCSEPMCGRSAGKADV